MRCLKETLPAEEKSLEAGPCFAVAAVLEYRSWSGHMQSRKIAEAERTDEPRESTQGREGERKKENLGYMYLQS